jgi:flagellar hook-basal body complex protein FliE
MPSPIGFAPVSPIAPVIQPAAPAAEAVSGEAFSNIFQDAVARVEETQKAADGQIRKFLSGENQEVHEVVIATQQAELTLEMFLQVRNKVVEAYQEIMRMQM